MKKAFLVLFLGMSLSTAAFAASRTIKGIDEQGKPCFLEILQAPVNDYNWAKVCTSYSGKMIFALGPKNSERLEGTRSFVSASTKMEVQVVYYPAQQVFVYIDSRSNTRTGEVFFEIYRECKLSQ